MKTRWMLALLGALAATSACSQTVTSAPPTTTTAALPATPAVTTPAQPAQAIPATTTAAQPAKTGKTVARYQQSLKSAGFDPGRVDGVMGRKTRAAIKAFQTAKSLSVTGRFDKATVTALKG